MRMLLPAFLLIALESTAQFDTPVPVQLIGASDADRQVTGLADPLTPTSGVSVDPARANATTFATASGAAVLTADLIPIPGDAARSTASERRRRRASSRITAERCASACR